MNAKAERIEHLIQIINRNLLLIYNGQVEGIIPLDNRPTARVDTSMFKGDKFGYEMVNFVRSYAKNQRLTIAAIWERNFVKGLETLITECAVVKDDIERECFVSRVYVWFVEKLVERRDLPESNRIQTREINELKENVKSFGANHTLKALDNYASGRHSDEESIGSPKSPKPIGKSSTNDTDDTNHDEKDKHFVDEWEVHLPVVSSKQRKGPQNILQQQYYPDININQDIHVNGQYKPETEAEITMNELWIARRRQEAFEWKAKQNVDLIMDRRSLHKSRMESETLRRQETSSYLAMRLSKNTKNHNDDDNYDEDTKFAPRMRRPLSGRKHFANIIVDAENNQDIQKTKDGVDIHSTTTFSVMKDGVVSEATVATVQRKIVEKPKKEIVPMRYKIDLPDGYAPRSTARKNSKNSITNNTTSGNESFPMSTSVSTTQINQNLPNLSSSLPINSNVNNINGANSTSIVPPLGNKQIDKRVSSAPASRHQKINSRKVSVSKLFNEVAHLDNELQVHLDFSNSRRMPMTDEQQKWLAMREQERQTKYKDYLAELALKDSEKEQKLQAKASKGKDKKKEGKDKPKKDTKSNQTVTITTTNNNNPDLPPPPPVLEDPIEIMEKKFPIFDADEYPDAQGALRCQQLEECNRVYEALARKFPNVDMSIIERALVTPQDRHIDVCMENLRKPLEGLMVNPLPVEYWRTSGEKTKKKKTKKTKSKKK